MKVLISADMEGISGVLSVEHVRPGNEDYPRFRQIMTSEVNAAVEGLFEGGADEVILTDGHLTGNNILIEELDPRVRLNSGLVSPYAMIEGVQYGADAVIFIGYHARMGTMTGVLDHTWSSLKIANLSLNGRLAGETALNGAVCGHFQVPVLMVSGDQALANEASGWIKGIETAVVKKATSRNSAECLPYLEAQDLIRTTALRAVQRHLRKESPLPLEIKTPITVTVEFLTSAMADSAEICPGTLRLDARKIEIVTPNMPAAYFAFRSLVELA